MTTTLEVKIKIAQLRETLYFNVQSVCKILFVGLKHPTFQVENGRKAVTYPAF